MKKSINDVVNRSPIKYNEELRQNLIKSSDRCIEEILNYKSNYIRKECNINTFVNKIWKVYCHNKEY